MTKKAAFLALSNVVLASASKTNGKLQMWRCSSVLAGSSVADRPRLFFSISQRAYDCCRSMYSFTCTKKCI